jgi:hypothetical protein
VLATSTVSGLRFYAASATPVDSNELSSKGYVDSLTGNLAKYLVFTDPNYKSFSIACSPFYNDTILKTKGVLITDVSEWTYNKYPSNYGEYLTYQSQSSAGSKNGIQTALQQNSKMVKQFECIISPAGTITNNYYWVGFSSLSNLYTTGPDNTIGFSFTGSGNWIVYAKAGGATTAMDSGVSVVAGTKYKFDMIQDFSATAWDMYINETKITTISGYAPAGLWMYPTAVIYPTTSTPKTFNFFNMNVVYK